MPRILSPNLGCPEIVSLESLGEVGTALVLADHPDRWDGMQYQLRAILSYAGECREFALTLAEPCELAWKKLPRSFQDVSETRSFINHNLRASTFKNRARFWRFREPLAQHHLREAQGGRRPTLYQIALCRGGEKASNFRYFTVTQDLEVSTLRPQHL